MSAILALTALAGLAARTGAECTSVADAATEAGLTSLVDTITSLGELEGAEDLLAAVTATKELDDKLTVFAPQNEGFKDIADVVSELEPEQVLAVLLNHVVAGELKEEDIAEAIDESSPASLETLGGGMLEASVDGEDVIVTPAGTDIKSKVVATDVETCAGVVHVIEKVLVPSMDMEDKDDMAPEEADVEEKDSMAPEMAKGSCMSIADYAIAANLTGFLDAIDAVMDEPDAGIVAFQAGLEEESEVPITLFVPNNEAFDLIGDVIASLTPDEIISVLLNHVVPEELNSTAVIEAIEDSAPEPAEIETLQASLLEATLVGDDVILTPNGTDIEAKVEVLDVETCSGIVHVIDMVLVPASLDLPPFMGGPGASTDRDGGVVGGEDEEGSSAFGITAAASVVALVGAVMMM